MDSAELEKEHFRRLVLRARRIAWGFALAMVAVVVLIGTLLYLSKRSYEACRDWQNTFRGAATEAGRDAAAKDPLLRSQRPSGCAYPK